MNDNGVVDVDRSTSSDDVSSVEAPSFVPYPPAQGLRRMMDVWSRPLHWAWEGLIPQGKLTFVTGESGVGKSWFALQAAAMATRGLLTPDPEGPRAPEVTDGWHQEGGCAPVLLFSSNDHLEDTVLHRLELLGADLSKVFVAEEDEERGLRWEVDSSENKDLKEPNSLEMILGKLNRYVDSIEGVEGPLKLIIIDSIDSYLAATGSHANQLKLISRLVRMAASTRAAVLVLANSTPAAVSKAKARIYDEFANVARSVLTIVKDLEVPERRLVLPVKMNLREPPPGVRFQFCDGKLEWSLKTTHLNSEQYLELAKEKRKNPLIREDSYEIQRVTNWLRNRLIEGTAASLEIRADAYNNSIAYTTLRRAFKALGCQALRLRGFNRWYWKLPGNHADWTLAPEMEENEDDLVDEEYAGIKSSEDDREDFESEAASAAKVDESSRGDGDLRPPIGELSDPSSVSAVDVEEDCEADGNEFTGAFPADREAPPAPSSGAQPVDLADDAIKDAQDVHQEEREHLCSST